MKIGRDGSNTIEDNFFQRRFVVGNYTHLFAGFQFFSMIFSTNTTRSFFHQADIDVTSSNSAVVILATTS
jgi:hypothetical protein